MRPDTTTLALAAPTKHHGCMNTFLLTLDLCGTFVFALSGGTLAARKRLDLFGVLVLSVAAAHAGGVLRGSFRFTSNIGRSAGSSPLAGSQVNSSL